MSFSHYLAILLGVALQIENVLTSDSPKPERHGGWRLRFFACLVCLHVACALLIGLSKAKSGNSAATAVFSRSRPMQEPYAQQNWAQSLPLNYGRKYWTSPSLLSLTLFFLLCCIPSQGWVLIVRSGTSDWGGQRRGQGAISILVTIGRIW